MKTIKKPYGNIRARNPFRDLLVTELIDNIDIYQNMFSCNILVGQACSVFQPGNVIVLGPQGSGKTMLLNLIRLWVLANWSETKRPLPDILNHVPPYFGISINLSRVSFHTFGRRSVSKALGKEKDKNFEVAAAADYISHYLFRELLRGIKILLKTKSYRLRNWAGLTNNELENSSLPIEIAKWKCWNGYYESCKTWKELTQKSSERLSIWSNFLNTNIDIIPDSIWSTKADPLNSLHSLGKFVRNLSNKPNRLSLFVYIDQYEVLKELNPTHGSELQRLINTLIKARDPYVFYRIGARTYDWGEELRVLGAESRIEIQRDYIVVNLTDVLMRNEDRKGYIYPEFAEDVACRRIKSIDGSDCDRTKFRAIFKKWNAYKEANLYFVKSHRIDKLMQKIPEYIKKKIILECDTDKLQLDLRLASAWVLQQLKRRIPEGEIIDRIKEKPWITKKWWIKERKEIALVQISSLLNQKRRYFGWDTICYLSGGNITTYLLICSEIWDFAAKLEIHPIIDSPLDPTIQSEGVLKASSKWRERDRNEPGGSQRYYIINRIGPAISNSVKNDFALSNPGHTGFSIAETDLYGEKKGIEIRKFLHNAVNWAILEERKHKSKHKDKSTRIKFYLHPLLSPSFDLPIKRVKEPYYTNVDEVYSWIFSDNPIKFGSKSRKKAKKSDNNNQINLFS